MSRSLIVLGVLVLGLCQLTSAYVKTSEECDACLGDPSAFYCASSSICLSNFTMSDASAFPECSGSAGWCNGEQCCFSECLNSVWPCSDSVVGMLMLMAMYGIILAYGAKLISDGSEMLMEIIDAGVVGGLLLPLLSAFPDAMIIVIAGALSSDPQTQLAIGIGTLAGSTVMLLTIPTSSALILARTDLKNDGKGPSIDGKLTKRFSLTKTGTTVDDDTTLNAKIMIGTSVSYLIVQSVAFAYLKSPESGKAVEKWFALVGFLVCLILMITYMVYQVVSPRLQEKKIAEAKKKYLLERTIHHFIHNLTKRRQAFASKNSNEDEGAHEGGDEEKSPLIHEEHKKPPVDIKKFGMKWKTKALEKDQASSSEDQSIQVKDEEEEEHKDEGPLNKRKIAIRSGLTLFIGAAMVTIFSDPMVDVITDFGNKIKVNLFFISFIITPFCSNASELISSLIFASKKKRANSSLTYSALYGSATMNNTMCLGIFYALVFFRGLTWSYSAETACILFVTLAAGIIGAKFTTLKTYFAPIFLSLYPLALLLVYVLETYAHWQ